MKPSRTDFERLDRMSDAEIEAAANADPDNPLLTDEQLANAIEVVPKAKQPGPPRGGRAKR